jgi:superfamily II DNA or RNA helicase
MNFSLRKHQRETVDVCREILEGKSIREIILSVTPGGGKSFVPVIVADNLIPAIAEKICWVVPRNSLKYQGEDEFCNPHWNTDKRIRAADNGSDLSRGLAGYVTTYQAVGMNPECHAAEFRKHKYILFLDEFHHIADGSEWHKAVQPLVDSAALVVKASGTLSRGDGQKIAFLDYSNGEPFFENTNTRRVITYGRSAAIADGAILPVKFELVDGTAEWEELDGHRNTSAISGEESAKALFTALRTEFATQLIEAAIKEYITIKENYTAAKMLVVAPNIEIAKTYFDYLYVHGYLSRIATSEDTPVAHRNIIDFKRGVFDILVSVAMASEGLNVPEVSVICFLTNVRSVPWIEQCVARSCRISAGKTRAVVFAPADWAFRKAVRMIEREQLVPLENPEGRQELITPREQQEGNGKEKPWIIPVASTAHIGETTVVSPAISTAPCTPSEAENVLRKNINNIIKVFLSKQHHGNRQHQQLMLYRRMKLICNKKLEEMTNDELVKVWVWVKNEYSEIEPEKIIGEKFGRWTVRSFAYSKNYQVYYYCICDCGTERIVMLDNIKSGKSYSCGCYNKERASETKKEHGMTKSRIHTMWCRIKAMCYNENNSSYKNYGGKGITVCNEWANNFEDFFKWALTNEYQDDLCLVRIDKSKGYNPENCKFASRSETAKGKSNGKTRRSEK